MEGTTQKLNWLHYHPCATLGFALAIAFVLGMKEIRALFTDLPHMTWTKSGMMGLGLWLYVLLLAFSYLVAAIALVRTLRADGSEASRPTRVLSDFAEGFLYTPAKRRTVSQRRVLGSLMGAIGLTLVATGVWRNAPGLFYWGILVSVTGAWFLLARFSESSEPSNRAVSVTRTVGMALGLLIISSFFGDLLWWLIGFDWNPLSWRLYSLWAITHFCLFVLSLGALADALGRTIEERLIVGTAIVIVLAVASARPVQIGRSLDRAALPSQQATADNLDSLSWFQAVDRRLQMMPKNEPVIFVAAAGGGARAALFATAVLEALERTPPHDSVGNWAVRESPDSSLLDRVLFISSVSGGSVASAHFLFGGDATEPMREPRNTLADELREQFINELDVLCKARKQRCRSAECIDCSTPEECQSSCTDSACREYARLCTTDPAGYQRAKLADPNNLLWPVHSRRIDDMATDFNAPLMKGIIQPGIERGESVTAFWKDRFGWQSNWTSSHAQNGDHPLLIINLTNVNAGTRVVAGFPPLPRGLLSDDPSKGFLDADLQFVQHAQALKDIHPFLDIDVEEAVRMSANFPWGFDLPELGRSDAEVLTIDGGVLDNTGIDTYKILLDRLELIADPNTLAEYPAELQRRAKDLLAELARRGIVILEIDSGAKPEPPGVVSRVFANLALPIHALSMSSHVRASEATGFHTTSIQNTLSHWAENHTLQECGADDEVASIDVIHERVAHVVYVLDTEKIMTAWALSPTQKAQLLARFLAEDSGQRTVLQSAFENLEGANVSRCNLFTQSRGKTAFREVLRHLAEDHEELSRLKHADIHAATELRRLDYDGTGIARTPIQGSSELGWLFVGHFDQWPIEEKQLISPRWLVSGLALTDRTTLPAELVGLRVSTSEPGYLYPTIPDRQGQFPNFDRIIRSFTEVEIHEVREWADSGFYFGRVSVTDRGM